MLHIKRAKDNRVVKCIVHRIADIPGGVTVSVANLGGNDLFEGTPIGVGANGLFVVCKTAQIVTKAEANATQYEVAKGHHFKVGDRFATDACNGQKITNIDKSNPAKDVITLSATLGAVVNPNTCAFESSGENKTLKVVPGAIVGSNMSVEPGENLFVDALVMGVVRKSNAPIVNKAIEEALKNVAYI